MRVINRELQHSENRAGYQGKVGGTEGSYSRTIGKTRGENCSVIAFKNCQEFFFFLRENV